MYSEGNETKRDLTKALHWYSVAAGLGDVPSQQRVGKAYYCGEGTKVTGKKQWLHSDTALVRMLFVIPCMS
jgi:TPR repeat protein